MSSRAKKIKNIKSKISKKTTKKSKIKDKKKIVVFKQNDQQDIDSTPNINNKFIKDTLSELDDKIYEKLDYDVLYELVMLKNISQDSYNEYIMQINNKNINNDDIIWRNPLLDDYRANHINFLNLFNFRQEHVTGVYTCKCGGNKVILQQKQTRGGDEGMTTIIKCVKCNNIWKEN